jgi:hypothetical protein
MGDQQKDRVANTKPKSQEEWGWGLFNPYSREDKDTGLSSVPTYIPGYRAQVGVVLNNTKTNVNTKT